MSAPQPNVLRLVSIVSVCCLTLALLMPRPLAAGQQPPPSEEPPPSRQEAGGRLLVTGETIVVVGDPDLPPNDASIASKVDAPLQETPRSVSVTDRQVLDDRLAVNISDAHDYTASLMTADQRGPAYSRGFFVSFYDLRRDGLRTYAWSVREPVAVERIQYLRGPAAILYGDGSPGGLVNMVLKKPLPVPRADVTASGGTLGFGRLTGDVTGPIGPSRRVRYRLVGAAEWLDGGIDNDERRLSLMPMMSFDFGRNATLHVDSEMYHQRGRNYRHVVPATADTQRGDFSKIPWDLSVTSPDEGWSGWNVSPGARLDLQLRPRVSLHSAVRYTRIGGHLDGQALLGLAGERTLNRFNYFEQSTWQEWQSDTFASTVANTGSIEHTLVAGVEAGLSTADSLISIGAGTPIDLYEPVYAPPPMAPSPQPTRYDVLRLGLYAQDQIRLHRSLIVVPGLRWSRLRVDDEVSRPALTPVEQVSTESEVSPSLGLVVLPRQWLSFYATASSGFEPPSPGQYREDGRALSPADVSSFEGGIKLEGLSGRVVASGAGYGIRRTNIAQLDALGFYREIGEGRSRGIELEAAGRVAAGLFVQAAYAWTDTEITRSLTGVGEGNELPNAPRHNASLWARYRVTSGPLARTMVAAGVVHVSDRFLAEDNVTIAPAYTRLDLSGSYELSNRRVRIGVAVPNATNRKYVTSGAGRGLWAGPARRIVVQASTRF